jgi:GT2 family glycosyltransferase
MIPVVIPSYSQLTYLSNTLSKLQNLNLTNIIIIDSASEYAPIKDLYKLWEHNASVIYLNENLGPRHFYENKDIYDSLPDYFIVTDPDLEFNKDLPATFIQDLIDISEQYKVGKVGFALSIADTEDIKIEAKKWEEKYWNDIVGKTKYGDNIFEADIDTTFALYNKKYINDTSFPGDFFKALRVSGSFTAKHWGWYNHQPVPEMELKHYREFQKWSSTETGHGKTGQWKGNLV